MAWGVSIQDGALVYWIGCYLTGWGVDIQDKLLVCRMGR